MRSKGILGSIAALTAGAGLAFGQGPSRGMAPPAPIMPSGLYNGSGVQPASYNPDVIPSPYGPAPMNGIPQGDPSGGLMQGPPMYPQPGIPGGSPYPDAGGGGNGNAGAVSTAWFNGEFLLWFPQSQRVPGALVTTSGPGDFGVPGAPTTQTLFSNRDISYGTAGGFRLMGGWWCDADKRKGFEFGGMLTEQKTNIFTATSDNNGVPTLARPFIVAGGGPGVYLVSSLGLASGTVTVSSGNRIWGAEGNCITNLYRSCPGDACFWSVDSLVGFRYFQLHETLNFFSSSTILNGGANFVGQPVLAGGQIIVQDGFTTANHFYGGQIGIRSSVVTGRWTISSSLKVAAGLMNQTVDVVGNTTLQDAGLGLNATAQGGVYATQQNIGNYRNDEFCVLPEIGLNFAYNWTDWLSTSIGYNGLYANRVVRPGNSLPSAVNPSLMPSSNNFGVGAVTPVINNSLTQTEFWIQGVTLGFNIRF